MQASFVMIGFAFQDCQRPVELFHEKKPYHLVRERHPGE